MSISLYYVSDKGIYMNGSLGLFGAICNNLKKKIEVRLRLCNNFLFFWFVKCLFFKLIIGVVNMTLPWISAHSLG